MRLRFFTYLACGAFGLAAAASACSSSSGSTGTLAIGSVERDLTPTVPTSDRAALASGGESFAEAMYGQLRAVHPNGNLFYSPYSIRLALAMTYNGARGTTATQLATALDFTLPLTRLDRAFDQVDLALSKVPPGALGPNGTPFTLRVADSIWSDLSLKLQPDFLDALSENFGAGVRQVDFGSAPDAAEGEINAWVDGATAGKIPELLRPMDITSETKLVLVNAVYFEAAWQTPFMTSETQAGSFNRTDGAKVLVPLMYSPSTATHYFKGSNYEAAELPYSGGTTSMVVILPNEGAFDAVEASMSSSVIAEVSGGLRPVAEIDLTLPKFKVAGTTLSLVQELEALGVKAAFDEDADFSGISTTTQLSIHDVLHQAYIDVDEGGTVAAASTAVTFEDAAVGPPVQSIVVDVDRPFFYFLRDIQTGTVLFVGCEEDPTK